MDELYYLPHRIIMKEIPCKYINVNYYTKTKEAISDFQVLMTSLVGETIQHTTQGNNEYHEYRERITLGQDKLEWKR